MLSKENAIKLHQRLAQECSELAIAYRLDALRIGQEYPEIVHVYVNHMVRVNAELAQNHYNAVRSYRGF